MEDNNQIQSSPETENMDTWQIVPDGDVPEVFKQQAQPEQNQVQQEETISSTEDVEPTYETQQTQGEPANDNEDVESAVIEYLSERLGVSINTLEDLVREEQAATREMDERVSAIAEFVEKTGRDPRDWFIYQSMNPSEMDDLTAVQVQMSTDYPNLSQEEIRTFISNKYKLDENLYGEQDVKMSMLQLKIDAEAARKTIDNIRSQYAAPERREAETESVIDDNWISMMRQELDDLEAIEFDLGNGQAFNFGLDERYKRDLADKNARLDEFFDPYVHEDGSWDFDKLNIHRAVIDNIDRIVQSVYRQGMSDGQRGIVEKAANVTPQSPNQGGTQPSGSQLSEQLRKALGGGNITTFNL